MDSELPALKADLFRALAHPTRIRILELLVDRACTVQDISGALGLDQPVASQHLAALRARHLVTVRREGTLAHYALRSRLVADLLRVAREFLNRSLTDSQTMLRELRRQDRRS